MSTGAQRSQCLDVGRLLVALVRINPARLKRLSACPAPGFGPAIRSQVFQSSMKFTSSRRAARTRSGGGRRPTTSSSYSSLAASDTRGAGSDFSSLALRALKSASSSYVRAGCAKSGASASRSSLGHCCGDSRWDAHHFSPPLLFGPELDGLCRELVGRSPRHAHGQHQAEVGELNTAAMQAQTVQDRWSVGDEAGWLQGRYAVFARPVVSP